VANVFDEKTYRNFGIILSERKWATGSNLNLQPRSIGRIALLCRYAVRISGTTQRTLGLSPLQDQEHHTDSGRQGNGTIEEQPQLVREAPFVVLGATVLLMAFGCSLFGAYWFVTAGPALAWCRSSRWSFWLLLDCI
jgi:hypothetical protein